MKASKVVLLFILSTNCLVFDLKEIRNNYLRKCYWTKTNWPRLIFNSGLPLIDSQTTRPRGKENWLLAIPLTRIGEGFHGNTSTCSACSQFLWKLYVGLPRVPSVHPWSSPLMFFNDMVKTLCSPKWKFIFSHLKQ